MRLPDFLCPEALDALEAVATEVALACGRLIVDERPDQVRVADTKSSAIDIVTEMDRRSEKLAQQLLAQRRPDDAMVGEEGADRIGTSGITWLVDPIDGTVNYLYGIEEYSVSVAAVLGDARTEGGWYPVAGAVYNPCTDDLFRARRGGGAELVRAGVARVLAPTPPAALDRSLVTTGFAYTATTRAHQVDAVARVLPRVRDIRRHGSAALDLCGLAAGRSDAYYEANLNAWDIAAGWVVAEEAGLVVRGPHGGRPVPALTLAGRPEILDQLEALIDS